jgi:sporulation protein YhbH
VALRIEQDHNRFKQIVRGRIKKNLKNYITHGEMIGRKGKDLISIPIPQIDLPHFVHGPRQGGGVGQGEGEVGQAIGQGEMEDGDGKAGNAPGQHILEVDIPLDELAQILGEELALPDIRNKGRKNIVAEKDRYTGISSAGPESLRHFKRTYKEALKRQIASGTYDPLSPRIVPIRRDRRYRTWKEQIEPEANAVIIYMMDVSGSMGEEQKEIVRIESFWIDTWLRSQYDGIETRYVIHDAEARLVDQETFYHTRESGGTVISSAYKLCVKLVQDEFPTEEWNTYLFHFSDGDNWSQGDTEECVRLLKEDLLPSSNLFCYGQVESPYGTGQFLQDLREAFPEEERVVISQIESKEAIYGSIKEFLGRGR